MDQLPLQIYQDNGFSSREEYLDSLRDIYGAEAVNIFLEIMPPSEDFDGLIVDLEDYVSGTGFYAMCNAELDGGRA